VIIEKKIARTLKESRPIATASAADRASAAAMPITTDVQDAPRRSRAMATP
jgi:hypothetical protein